MATIIDPPNSVWPNGLKVDSEGYVTFYPLGTNKVDITANMRLTKIEKS